MVMTIKRTTNDRKRKEFRAALALAGLTLTKWAERQDVTPEHVWQVLSGNRESNRLMQEVDALISEYLPESAA